MTDLLTSHAFADFPADFKGDVLRATDEGYQQAKQIWNVRRAADMPALIVQPVGCDDVVTAVRYANSQGVPVAVKGGGHGVDCSAMPQDALVIDMTHLKGITIDAQTGVTTIEAGVRLGEMDAATQVHGYAVPAGVVSDTGAVALTLGGGIGHLTRRFGATVDNLLSVDVVTADGRVLTASTDSNPDLFWGMQGAGHNLAIATSATFQAYKVGPEVMSGMLLYSAQDAVKILGGLDAALASAPRELAITLNLLPAPPVPGLPTELIGTPVLLALVVYTGALDEYESAMAAMRALATPLTDLVQRTSWIEANRIVDRFAPPGRSQYLIGGYLQGVNAQIAQIALDRIAAAPPARGPRPSCLVTLPGLGGALLDVAEDATAFSRSGAQWLFEVIAQWDSPGDDDEYVAWVHDTVAVLQPWASTNAYVNLTADQGPAWLRGAYGSPEKWQRIVELKQSWDPDNLLAYNKNVRRAAAAAAERT